MGLKDLTNKQFLSQLGGMYGLNVSNALDIEANDEPADIANAIEKLGELYSEDGYMSNDKRAKDVGGHDYWECVADILGIKMPAYEYGGSWYVVPDKKNVSNNASYCKMQDFFEVRPLSEIFDITKLYKFVRKTKDGRYVSVQDPTFEYKVGEEVTAKNYYYWLYFCYSVGINMSTSYSTASDTVLIECTYEKLKETTGNPFGELQTKTATMVREVPEDEVKAMMERNGDTYRRNGAGKQDEPLVGKFDWVDDF